MSAHIECTALQWRLACWEGRSRVIGCVYFRQARPDRDPPELADEPTLPAYLGVRPKELKKVWYRGWLYQHFSIAKGAGRVRLISAPDRRLKILKAKLARLLDQLHRFRNPIHGLVSDRSVKTTAEAHAPGITQMRLIIFVSISACRWARSPVGICPPLITMPASIFFSNACPVRLALVKKAKLPSATATFA